MLEDNTANIESANMILLAKKGLQVATRYWKGCREYSNPRISIPQISRTNCILLQITEKAKKARAFSKRQMIHEMNFTKLGGRNVVLCGGTHC